MICADCSTAIQLLDSLGTFHFGRRSQIPLEAAQGDLPHDGLWAATDARQWQTQLEKSKRELSESGCLRDVSPLSHIT